MKPSEPHPFIWLLLLLDVLKLLNFVAIWSGGFKYTPVFALSADQKLSRFVFGDQLSS